MPGPRQGADEQQADGPGAEQHDLRPRAVFVQFAGVHAVQHAGQRLRQRRLAEGQPRRDGMGILFHEARGHSHEFGEGAVEVLDIGAEVFPPARAVITVAAGGGVGDHHGVAFAELGDALAHGRHAARHFVPKERRNFQHAGMAAALEHLHVGAAGGRGLDAQDDLAVVRFGHGQVADLDRLGPQQHGPLHHAGHDPSFLRWRGTA